MATAKYLPQVEAVIKAFLLLISLVLSGHSMAVAQASSDTVGAELAARFSAVESWSGEFEQLLVDINGREQERVTGRFALQQPNLIDWHYDEPLNQRLVSDGTSLWFYDRDLEQVTVRAVADLLDQSPAAILLGRLPAAQAYTFSFTEQQRADGALVERYTMARNGAGDLSVLGQIEELRIDWSADRLLALRVTDNFGQQTTVNFHRLQRNIQLPTSQFRFDLPQGVEIVR